MEVSSYLSPALLALLYLLTPGISAQALERDPLLPLPMSSGPAYQSAFMDYKNFQEPEMIPWKTANDNVAQADGTASDVGGATKNPAASEKNPAANAGKPLMPHQGHMQKPKE